ncbi:hypothetical protein ACFFX0_02045 [Citricoccus parietis]|uniref:Uncharacterized protein n=1 Tax=Citricoccus parietis TaxID=592307 RepID=A0ABV5FTM7_9MICC
MHDHARVQSRADPVRMRVFLAVAGGFVQHHQVPDLRAQVMARVDRREDDLTVPGADHRQEIGVPGTVRGRQGVVVVHDFNVDHQP